MRPSELTAVSHLSLRSPEQKGSRHSRLISPYLIHCSAVSQIGRLSGLSKYNEPKKKLGTVNLGNTSRYIDTSLTECLPFPCDVNGAPTWVLTLKGDNDERFIREDSVDRGRCRFGVSWRAGGWNMVPGGQRTSRRPTEAPGSQRRRKTGKNRDASQRPG